MRLLTLILLTPALAVGQSAEPGDPPRPPGTRQGNVPSAQYSVDYSDRLQKRPEAQDKTRTEVDVIRTGPESFRAVTPPASLTLSTPVPATGAYAPGPYVPAPEAAPAPAGGTGQMSELEHGRLLMTALEASPPDNSRSRPESILHILRPNEDSKFKFTANVELARVTVRSIHDRGLLALDTGEEVKLRGVNIPSEETRDEFLSLYSREAQKAISELIGGQPVRVAVDDPVRDTDGTILVTVFLASGKQLNLELLRLGLGRFDPADFPPGRDVSAFRAVQALAQDSKTGIWSITRAPVF